MIVVEGCDGAGKSTLCSMLLEHRVVDQVLPSPRIAAKNNVERMKYETGRYLQTHRFNQRVAIDRFLFSEMAYGPVFRGQSAFSRGEYLTTLLDLMLSNSFVIFCDPIRLNFKPTESPQLLEKMEEVRSIYRTLMEDSAFSNKRTYIYKWDEFDAFNQLKKFIKEN